jgi:flagellar hook-basal body complex protein FliE
MTSPIAAANAYRLTSGLAGSLAGGQKPQGIGAGAGGAEAGGFGSMLSQAVGQLVETGRAAEAKQAAYAAGKGDIVDVVTAVAETEVALDTMVSMRDKVIQAYESIMSMPI